MNVISGIKASFNGLEIQMTRFLTRRAEAKFAQTGEPHWGAVADDRRTRLSTLEADQS